MGISSNKFHFKISRGSWGLWGGSCPAPNVKAKAPGSSPVKFLPAPTPGLWLKNQGAQAGAEQPRGLRKHGRCRQAGLWGPRRPAGAARAVGWAMPVAEGGIRWRRQAPQNRDLEGQRPRETGQTDGDRKRQSNRDSEKARDRDKQTERGENGKKELQRNREKKRLRQKEIHKEER